MQPAAVGCHLDRAVGESLGLTHPLALRLGLGLGRTGTRDLGGAHWDSLTHTHTHTHPSTGNGGRGQARWRDLEAVGRSVGRSATGVGGVCRSVDGERERKGMEEVVGVAYILWVARVRGGGTTKEGLDNSIVLGVACRGGRGLSVLSMGVGVPVGDKGDVIRRSWTGLAVDMLRAGAGKSPYSPTYLAVNAMEKPKHGHVTEELISPWQKPRKWPPCPAQPDHT